MTKAKLVLVGVPEYHSTMVHLSPMVTEDWLIVVPKSLMPYVTDFNTQATIITPHEFSSTHKPASKFKEFNNILYYQKLPTFRSKMFSAIIKCGYGKNIYLPNNTNHLLEDRSLEVKKLLKIRDFEFSNVVEGKLEVDKNSDSLLFELMKLAKREQSKLEHFSGLAYLKGKSDNHE
ncbi:hypothetical protein VPHK120G1_0029 [Vibrio phage K120 g1]